MRLGIIGCGTIAATYVQALAHLGGAFQITALYDVLPEKAEALGITGAQICGSMEELMTSRDVDCVVISTPLSTHVTVAEACLRRKKHVLLEKPAALSVEKIAELFDLAEEMGVAFHVGFHSSFGIDIQWYLDTEGKTNSIFGKKNICRAECWFYDPYVVEGQMQEDRKPLGGSYIDSGVNILSVCSRLVSIKDMKLQAHKAQKTVDGVVYASDTVFRDEKTELVAHTGWDKGQNHKSTLLRFSGTQDAILLDHTGQSVWRIPAEGEKQLIFCEDTLQRMVNQYIIVFKEFARMMKQKSDPVHREQVMKVHELLLSVGEEGIGSL